jgi:hypothetical protein
LDGLLAQDDTRAQALMRDAQILLRAALGERFAPLARQVDQFEFEAALLTLRQADPRAAAPRSAEPRSADQASPVH